MTKRLKHIGVEAFLAERKGLLDAYDQAKAKTADESVRADHGNAAEKLFRDWLTSFLPKRFGVTKGYIITTNLNYDGPIEEWDILIYDALEAPVLFYKDPKGGEDPRRAIPVEYVRGVLEVKATLTPAWAKKVEVKLSKLQPFLGTNTSPLYKEFLCEPFISAAVFFETKVKNLKEYRRALDNLTKLYQAEPM